MKVSNGGRKDRDRWEDREQEGCKEEENGKASLDSSVEEKSEQLGRYEGGYSELGKAIDGKPADGECVEAFSGSHGL